MALASLARWFRGNDRQTLKHAIENEEIADQWAKRMMRDRQRSPEELIPLPSFREHRTDGNPARWHRLRPTGKRKRGRYCPRWGIKPEHAAISKKAAIEALLKIMPTSRKGALAQAELFEKAGVITKTTGQRALNALLDEKQIHRVGQGGMQEPYRYHAKK